MPDLTLDLRYLKYAILVAEHGSFRRVADVLDLSQSTISRRVQLLEARLGLLLFERSSAGARLTHAGERFIRDAAIGAEHLRQAVNEIGLVRRGDKGELRIGLMASLARGFLAELVEAYHRRYPNIALKVEEATALVSVAGILDRRIDVAFVPGRPRVPGCRVKHLWDEQLLVAMPIGHPLATSETVHWDDLRDETFLVSADLHGPEVEGIIARKLSELGFHPKVSVQNVGRENLINMVGKDLGLTLAAYSTAGATYPGVVFRPVDHGTEIVSSSVVWSKANMNPALKPLLELGTSLAGPYQSSLEQKLELGRREKANARKD